MVFQMQNASWDRSHARLSQQWNLLDLMTFCRPFCMEIWRRTQGLDDFWRHWSGFLSDVTAMSLEWWLVRGNHPHMALFHLISAIFWFVNSSNLPRLMRFHQSWTKRGFVQLSNRTMIGRLQQEWRQLQPPCSKPYTPFEFYGEIHQERIISRPVDFPFKAFLDHSAWTHHCLWQWNNSEGKHKSGQERCQSNIWNKLGSIEQDKPINVNTWQGTHKE